MQFLGFQCEKVRRGKLQLPETAGTHLLLLLYARCYAGGCLKAGGVAWGEVGDSLQSPPPPYPLLVKRQFRNWKFKEKVVLFDATALLFLDIILNFLQCMYSACSNSFARSYRTLCTAGCFNANCLLIFLCWYNQRNGICIFFLCIYTFNACICYRFCRRSFSIGSSCF